MHAGFCLISFICVYFGYPETMGVALEEMGKYNTWPMDWNGNDRVARG